MNKLLKIKLCAIAVILIASAVLVCIYADEIDGNEVLEQIKADERKGRGVC